MSLLQLVCPASVTSWLWFWPQLVCPASVTSWTRCSITVHRHWSTVVWRGDSHATSPACRPYNRHRPSPSRRPHCRRRHCRWRRCHWRRCHWRHSRWRHSSQRLRTRPTRAALVRRTCRNRVPATSRCRVCRRSMTSWRGMSGRGRSSAWRTSTIVSRRSQSERSGGHDMLKMY